MTQPWPLVSVLVVLYNHEGFIVQCLDSILNDPYPAKDIVVLDDGSTDGSAEAVERWFARNSHRLKGQFRFRRRNNQGLCRSLNELVSLARGEYIVLVASDDLLLPGGIQARLNYLRERRDKLAVFADCVVIDTGGNLLYKSGIEELYRGRKKYLAHERLRASELIFRWCVPGPVFMAKKEAFRQVGGYDEDLLVEDWDFYMRLLSRNLLGFLDFPVAAYRMHIANTISNKSLTERAANSKLKTAGNHLLKFKGLKRARLFTVRTALTGQKYIATGKLFKGVLLLGMGRLLYKITALLYSVEAPLVFQFNKGH